jgi:hypothetical protein
MAELGLQAAAAVIVGFPSIATAPQRSALGFRLRRGHAFQPTTKSAIAQTEKAKELLKQLRNITKQEVYDAEVKDMPVDR